MDAFVRAEVSELKTSVLGTEKTGLGAEVNRQEAAIIRMTIIASKRTRWYVRGWKMVCMETPSIYNFLIPIIVNGFIESEP
jgi:hypothetical protein